MSSASQLPNPLSFGLGCFAFEMVPQDAARWVTFETWRSEVEQALSSIPSVQRVEVSIDETELAADGWHVLPQQTEGPPEIQDFEPDLRGARIAFEVSIPSRLHSELLQGDPPHAGERFHVETIYDFHGPCTFVTCLDSQGSGSQAVRLLWNFLKREIPRASNQVKFTILGPSPLHADFILEPAAASDILSEGPFGWEVLSRIGYADLQLQYDPAIYSSIKSAYEDLKIHLGDELSLFYQVIRYRDWTLRTSRYLNHATADLVKSHTKSGFRSSIGRVFRSGASARDLGLKALQAKLTLGRLVEITNNAVTQVYAQSGTIGCLREYIDEAAPNTENVAIANVLDVVQFAENGRTKELEIAVVSASTLLGGAAGAIAALIAS